MPPPPLAPSAAAAGSRRWKISSEVRPPAPPLCPRGCRAPRHWVLVDLGPSLDRLPGDLLDAESREQPPAVARKGTPPATAPLYVVPSSADVPPLGGGWKQRAPVVVSGSEGSGGAAAPETAAGKGWDEAAAKAAAAAQFHVDARPRFDPDGRGLTLELRVELRIPDGVWDALCYRPAV